MKERRPQPFYRQHDAGAPGGIEMSAVVTNAHALVVEAKSNALCRISSNIESIPLETRNRIEAALERRLLPYLIENGAIANQLGTPEYKRFAKDTENYLGAKIGGVVCPDGRILLFALGDPRVSSFQRRLQGLPETRTSTRESNKLVLDDPDLAAIITSDTAKANKTSTDGAAEQVEFVGPHIVSTHPEEGCGACIGKLQRKGHIPELAMSMGGVPEYFDELGDGFFAFNNVVERAGGKGTTFDMTHDAYSQGLIFGLRDEYKNFNRDRTLRENLIDLARRRKILMTELLNDLFAQRIQEEARRLGADSPIDVTDYEKFGPHAMTIGKIARKITQQEEEKGFPWIPNSLRDGKSEKAIRALGYTAVRNVVYTELGAVKPGQHILQKHPEQLIRVGPIGADFNTRHIPFVQNTPRGRFRTEDYQGVAALYNLASSTLREQGVDLRREGRIILVTGLFDESRYNPNFVNEEFEHAASSVRNNAAWVRTMFGDAIPTGEAIIIGALYEPGTKRLVHIV